MGRGRTWRAVACCGLAALLLALPVPGATEAAQPLVIGYSSFDASLNALFVTNDKGFFAQRGVDAKLVFLESASRATQAVAAGAADVTIVSGISGMEAIANGLAAVFIGETLETVGGSVVTRASLTDPRTQLRGARFAISSFGSDSDLGARKAIEHYGLTPDRDVTLLVVGNQTLRFAAVESGAAAATILLPPLLNQVQADRRYTVWVAISTLVPNFMESAWLVRRDALRARPDAFRALLEAYAAGTAFYKTHRTESLPVVEKWLKVDARAAAEAYDYYAPGMVVDPRISPQAFQHTLEALPAGDRQKLSMTNAVDLTLVSSLEREGYFKTLAAR